MLAVAGVVIGSLIALIGIFNPMLGVTSEELPPDINIHDVVEWTAPENTSSSNKTDWGSKSTDRIYYKEGSSNNMSKKYLDLECYRIKDWKDEMDLNNFNLDNTKKEEIEVNGQKFMTYEIWSGHLYAESPNGEYMIELWLTDKTYPEEMTDEEYKKADKEQHDTIMEVVNTFEWKDIAK